MKLFLILIQLLTVLSFRGYAQEEKSLNEKLDNIKGAAEEIIIRTDKGEFSFKEGEAEEVLKRIRKKNRILNFGDLPKFQVLIADSLSKRLSKFNFDSLLKIDKKSIKIKTNFNDSIFAGLNFNFDSLTASLNRFKNDTLFAANMRGMKKYFKNNFIENGKFILPGKSIFIFKGDSLQIIIKEETAEGNKEEITVKKEGNETTVTISRLDNDGKVYEEILTGKEAEEYLERLEDIEEKQNLKKKIIIKRKSSPDE
jgi:hypothetical protein